ncbi:MAG: hypothetical protein KatS3mg015_1703 [Fimbriimonadales bacterium]|nr:MAG: hypothetical protein KatS3mg015_1703 [Fimbriimonadales bacterium]
MTLALRLVAGAVVAALGAAAAAQCQAQRLLATDGAPGLNFGRNIVSRGDWCFASCDSPDEQGEVHVFRRSVGGGWEPSGILRARDGQRGDAFGSALALRAGSLFVGAQYANGNHGAVYVFDFDGTRWIEVQKFTGQGADSLAEFGVSLAVDGGTLVVGAPFDYTRDTADGAVYIFERNQSGQWVQKARLTASDGRRFAFLGRSVDIEGGTVVAGAPGDWTNSQPGAVYVFKRNASGVWSQVQKIRQQGGSNEDELGISVGLEGNMLVAGAYRYPDEIDVGAIFVFERAATDQPFFQTAMLTLPDGAPDDALGRHLDFRFGRIVAGSRGRYLFRGGAYVWEKRGLGWRLIGELLAEGGAPIDRMGWGISIADDGTAIVGSHQEDNENGEQAGAVYVFDLDCPAEIREVTVLEGQLLSGGIPELRHSDDSYLVTRAKVTGQVSQPHLMRLRLGATTRRLNPDTIEIRVEGRITDVSAQTTLFLRDWVTDDLVAVSQYPMTMEENARTFTVPNASRFIRSGDGRIELEVRQIVFFPFTLGGFQTYFDQIEIHAR